MQSTSTCLRFDGQAEEAAKFYVSVFPNSRILDTKFYLEGAPSPAGSVLTVRFTLDGTEYLALNGGPHFTFSPAVSLVAYCDTQQQVDTLWSKLLAGGQESQCGWLTDRFGVSWQVVPRPMLASPMPCGRRSRWATHRHCGGCSRKPGYGNLRSPLRTCPQIGRPCVVTTKRWMLGASRSLGLGPRQGLQRRRRALSPQPYGPGPYGAHAGVATRLWCAAPRRDSLLRLRSIGTRRRAFLFADKFLTRHGAIRLDRRDDHHRTRLKLDLGRLARRQPVRRAAASSAGRVAAVRAGRRVGGLRLPGAHRHLQQALTLTPAGQAAAAGSARSGPAPTSLHTRERWVQ